MSFRLVAAAKGLAVGVLTIAISVAGAYAYATWRSTPADADLGDSLLGLAVVLLALLLALGPLLARAFRLPHPARYMIPPILAGLLACVVLRLQVGPASALIPFAAYPVIAAVTADRRLDAPVSTPG